MEKYEYQSRYLNGSDEEAVEGSHCDKNFLQMSRDRDEFVVQVEGSCSLVESLRDNSH